VEFEDQPFRLALAVISSLDVFSITHTPALFTLFTAEVLIMINE
jgi:hypothetical protein